MGKYKQPEWMGKEQQNWLSIKKANKCLFSRRNGIKGKLIFGYSVMLRIFGIDII